MTYTIHIENKPIASLNLSDDPYWETANGRYPILRQTNEMPNWGPEARYEVPLPQGGHAIGSCSNHDGCGVFTPDGDWGFKNVGDDETQLGPNTRLTINRPDKHVHITTTEPPAMLPYIICGLCILLDTQ